MDRFSEVYPIFPHCSLKSREREVKLPCFYSVWWALWPHEEKINNHGCWGKHAHIPDNDYWGICLFHVVWTNFFGNYSKCGTHGIYNLPERVQILGRAHIICITVREDRIICCQIFCDLLLKSAFEQIFNVMQLILVKIKWHIKWKYLIQKFHDICLSYYFKPQPQAK